MPPLAMDDDGRVLRKGTKVVRFNFMLVLLGVVSRHLSARVSPRLFDGAAFPKESLSFESWPTGGHDSRIQSRRCARRGAV